MLNIDFIKLQTLVIKTVYSELLYVTDDVIVYANDIVPRGLHYADK